MSPRLSAIVLAAGAASRFGGAKLLAPWRGGVLLDGALAAALAAPVDEVLVVLGTEARSIGQAVHAFAAARGREARLIYAADHREGLSASLQAGLRALAPNSPGALVLLGDMPLVPHAALLPLTAAVEAGAAAAAPCFQGRRGHPVALSRALFGAVSNLRGDQGAGPLLDELGEGLVLIPIDNAGVLMDVDVREDLAALDAT